MSFSSLELLQFGELTALVARYAGSVDGRERVEALAPNSERVRIEAALADAGEAIAYTRDLAGPQQTGRGAAVRLRFDRVPEVGPAVARLGVEGAALEGSEILDLFKALDVAGEYRGVLTGVRERFPRLARRGDRLADLRGVGRRWERAFLPDGSLSDDASPALARIRREMERQRRAIQDSLERFLRAHRSEVQEQFVTIREDRYVVPIVAGQKGRVDGVIHGSSGTGRTLFVEPLETIGLNNELVRLREDEVREVERILSEITAALREHAEEIRETVDELAELDCVFAKAGFAADYGAVVPRFSPDERRRFALKEARHPLLESILRRQKKRVVPVSFELDEQQRCLLISGPNTGGKTVTMKTAGLLSLMAHAGLPVPCAEAEFPVLGDVLADIGDAQSIAESLSSFSGHLVHVKQMLEHVTPDSLVLLDELGRATDPEEGGALGVAILDEFRKSGAFCMASTHLLPLKLYGARTAGVVNASMGFDEATLEPTYQLRVGMPGKSAGLDIATRLEMPAEILRHARSVLPRMQADFQALLTELHGQIEENARRGRELEEAVAAARRREQEVEREAARREERQAREWDRKTEALIADFEARAQETIGRIAETGEKRKGIEQAERLVSRTRREFRQDAAEVRGATEVKPTPAQQSLEPGVRVRLRDVREPATVRRILKNGMVEVEAGFLKMQAPREDIVEVLAPGTEPPRRTTNVRVETGPRWDESYRELNLIGQRAEEAAEQVDKFLDSAALASVNRVRIVHGHGMGVLKRTVGEVLAQNPHVARFYPAAQNEGGTGAAIAELRE